MTDQRLDLIIDELRSLTAAVQRVARALEKQQPVFVPYVPQKPTPYWQNPIMCNDSNE